MQEENPATLATIWPQHSGRVTAGLARGDDPRKHAHIIKVILPAEIQRVPLGLSVAELWNCQNFIVLMLYMLDLGAKGDWHFRISDLVKNPDGTDI